MDERKIGFIQGVAYASSMLKKHNMDAYDLIKESGIPLSDFKKFADKSDVEVLEELFENIKMR